MFNTIAKGSTIGVLSPAYIPLKERVTNGINYLKEKGYNVKLSSNFFKQHGYFAGTDAERVDDIHELYRDKDVSVILAARGGWGTLRLLDKLDYDLIKNNPKPLIGYSDLTSLQLAIWSKTRIGSISGPMCAVEMGKGIHEFTEKHFWDYISNTESDYKINLKETSSTILCEGKAQGTLLGGCLSLVSFLQGTPYCPDFEGSILFLEDVGEKPYKIDRYFAHLKQCGVFDKISGLILGDFLDCEEEDSGTTSFTLQTIIEDYFANARFPVICDFPYGHGDIKISMPIGGDAKFDTFNMNLTFGNLFNN
jgi:muramoyltetrapeptide carboxypeptidase